MPTNDATKKDNRNRSKEIKQHELTTESSFGLPQMLVAPTLLAVSLVVATKELASKKPAIRKKINQNVLWKTQMFLHPAIVFALIFLSFKTRSSTCAFLIVPFAFNFGVESLDMPTDPIFLAFYHVHHYALVLGACVGVIGGTQTPGMEYGTSQALLLGHAWALHTIGFATHKKWIDKQTMVWPYIGSGFLFKLLWWSTIGSVPVWSILRLSVYGQYVGRWGLYLRLCGMYPFLRDPKSPSYDRFEVLKQPTGALTFALSFIVVF